MKSIFALLVIAACSHDPLEPGAGNSTGGGTSTLLVTGSAMASPNITDGQTSADFTTDFNVRVSLGGTPVTAGTVTMKSTSGSVALTFTTQNQGGWQGSSIGYDEVYQLDVTSGTDTVTGVIVDGPDIHVITGPTAGATLDSTMPFNTTWNRHDAADQAAFSVGDTNGLVIPDNGTYSVAAGSLKADNTNARTNTIRLTRTNNVAPAGAVAGSMMTVGVVNDLDVVAAPCPTC